MKLAIPLMLVLAALLSACSRPVLRRTVVERPVVVDRPVAAGQSAPTPRTCSYAAATYSHNAMACQADRYQYRCNDGTWERTVSAC